MRKFEASGTCPPLRDRRELPVFILVRWSDVIFSCTCASRLFLWSFLSQPQWLTRPSPGCELITSKHPSLCQRTQESNFRKETRFSRLAAFIVAEKDSNELQQSYSGVPVGAGRSLVS